MLFDYTHAFPVLLAKVLILGVITQVKGTTSEEDRKLSFVQLPPNLPRFYVSRAGRGNIVPAYRADCQGIYQ